MNYALFYILDWKPRAPESEGKFPLVCHRQAIAVALYGMEIAAWWNLKLQKEPWGGLNVMWGGPFLLPDAHFWEVSSSK